MIEDSPILQLRRSFIRPNAEDLNAIDKVPTSFIVDCMDGRGSLHCDIKPLLPVKRSLVGTAVTCECGPADNLGVLGALDIAQPGDIIVASTDSHKGCAVIGDLVLEMMKNKGVIGFVTDGLARDIDGIERVGLPLFCKGLIPNSPARNGPATAGFPVNLDATHICPGDIVVADRDGVVVIPFKKIPQVVERLVPLITAESELLNAVECGLTLPSFYLDLVEEGKVVEVD